MSNGDMQVKTIDSRNTWWGAYEIPTEMGAHWQLGPLDLVAEHRPHELRFSSRVGKDPRNVHIGINCPMEQVEHAADTDRLTNLANRRRMDEFLDALVTLYPEERQPFSLIITDVDNFKHYNDTNGHQMGDVVLASIKIRRPMSAPPVIVTVPIVAKTAVRNVLLPGVKSSILCLSN